MGGKNKKSAESCGSATEKQSKKPIPDEDPVLECENKHWFAFRVVDEAGAVMTNLVASITLVGGGEAIVDQLAEDLEEDGTWRSSKTLESGDCSITFPKLYNMEWWPKGGSAGDFTVTQTTNVGDDLCVVSIADSLGFRDYKSIWSRSKNKTLVNTRPNANQLVNGDQLFAPDQKDKIVKKATDQVWTFVVKTKHLPKVRVVLVDKDNKPLKDKEWEVSEPVEASGKTGADGVIEFTDIPPQETTAKLKVKLKEPPPPLDPIEPSPPATPTKYPADIASEEFTDVTPGAGRVEQSYVEWKLTLGGLPSFNTKDGVRARLYNLGFGCSVDDDDARCKRAVQAYQLFFLKQAKGSGVEADIEADVRNRHDKP